MNIEYIFSIIIVDLHTIIVDPLTKESLSIAEYTYKHTVEACAHICRRIVHTFVEELWKNLPTFEDMWTTVLFVEKLAHL